MEEPPGFEPGIAPLQAAALPLGDSSTYVLNIWWYPEPDLNRHGHNDRGILSPLCLPFHHPGLKNRYHIYRNVNCLWSGRTGSNRRPQPWQGYALPLSYARKSIPK